MEPVGFEPTTFCLQGRRSPARATTPHHNITQKTLVSCECAISFNIKLRIHLTSSTLNTLMV